MDTECFLGDGYKALPVYSVKIYIELHFSITLLLFAQMGEVITDTSHFEKIPARNGPQCTAGETIPYVKQEISPSF